MNFYFVLFVVLGTTLPREVSSEENCSVPGDEDFESRSEDCYNSQDFPEEDSRSTCHDLRYGQYGDLLPPSSKDPGNYYILFVFLDCLPVLILAPLILFFNINLASGVGHSIIFSTQVLLAFFSIDQSNFGIYLFGSGTMMVSGLLVFFNTPLMTFWYPLTLAHIALGYVKVVLAVVIVVVYLGVATASQCPVQCCRGCWARLRRRMRHWREAHLAQRPLFTGACSVAILIYGSLLDVSFRLILGGYRLDSVCVQNEWWDYNETVCHYHRHTILSPAICWGSPNHLPYLVPALVIVTLSLLPILLFFYHPGVPALVSFITKGRLQLPRLHKIKPVLDVFQGVYRPKMQFFAGLHLLHRVLLWITIAYYSNDSSLSIYYWWVALGIHCVLLPFESYRHNYLESLIMISVSLSAYEYSLSINPEEYNFMNLIAAYSYYIRVGISYFTLFVFPNLPLICVIVYYIYKLVRLCCCRRRQNYQEIPEEQEDIEESFQGERWQPPEQALLN